MGIKVPADAILCDDQADAPRPAAPPMTPSVDPLDINTLTDDAGDNVTEWPEMS